MFSTRDAAADTPLPLSHASSGRSKSGDGGFAPTEHRHRQCSRFNLAAALLNDVGTVHHRRGRPDDAVSAYRESLRMLIQAGTAAAKKKKNQQSHSRGSVSTEAECAFITKRASEFLRLSEASLSEALEGSSPAPVAADAARLGQVEMAQVASDEERGFSPETMGMQYFSTPVRIGGALVEEEDNDSCDVEDEEQTPRAVANVVVMFNLSLVHMKCNSLDRAIDLLDLALKATEGEDDIDSDSEEDAMQQDAQEDATSACLRLMALANLGYALYWRGDFQESIQALEEAACLAQERLDDACTTSIRNEEAAAHLRLSAIFANLSRAHHAAGNLEGALSVCDEANEMHRAAISAGALQGQNQVSPLLFVKAAIQRGMCRRSEALESLNQFHQELLHYQNIYPANGTLRSWAAGTLHEMGEVLFELGHLHEAPRAFLRSFDMWSTLCDGRHERATEALYWVGRSLHDREDIGDALEVYRRVLRLQQLEVASPSSPGDGDASLLATSLPILRTACNISRVHYARGELVQALEVSHEVLRIARAELGPGHEFVAEGLLSKGTILTEMGHAEEAVRVLVEAAAILEANGVESKTIRAKMDGCRSVMPMGQRRPDAAAA